MGKDKEYSERLKAFGREVAQGRQFTEEEAEVFLKGPKKPKPPQVISKPKLKIRACCMDGLEIPSLFKPCIDCPKTGESNG